MRKKTYDFKIHSKVYSMPKVGVRPTIHTAFQRFTQEKLPGKKKNTWKSQIISLFLFRYQ